MREKNSKVTLKIVLFVLIFSVRNETDIKADIKAIYLAVNKNELRSNEYIQFNISRFFRIPLR